MAKRTMDEELAVPICDRCKQPWDQGELCDACLHEVGKTLRPLVDNMHTLLEEMASMAGKDSETLAIIVGMHEALDGLRELWGWGREGARV